jgi:hypothetical protein
MLIDFPDISSMIQNVHPLEMDTIQIMRAERRHTIVTGFEPGFKKQVPPMSIAPVDYFMF